MHDQLRGVCYVILLPEYSKHRVQEAEMTIGCAKEERVDYLSLISYLGVGSKTQRVLAHMEEYAQLEKSVAQVYDENSHCVIRLPLFYQFFYYLGPMMMDDDQQTIGLPVSKGANWDLLAMEDGIDGILALSTPNRQKNRTLFELTPSDHTLNATALITAANQGLDREMTYQQLKPVEMTHYLERIHNDSRFRGGLPGNALPLGQYLNKYSIGTLLDYWALSECGHTDKITDDLKNAIGRLPMALENFFRENRHHFTKLSPESNLQSQ
ncbi:hypothetical protein BY458DRAFT_503637 [Sporodiniella umbellata]|nr:hypothetical protein BY458DRAFT_503637 [Sporodiniella umbellata]